MNPRAPDSEEISVVLLGSLNPGIFHPEWFRRQEILSPQEAEEARRKLVSPEVTEVLFLDMKLDVFRIGSWLKQWMCHEPKSFKISF